MLHRLIRSWGWVLGCGMLMTTANELRAESSRQASDAQHLARGTPVLRVGSGCTYSTIQSAVNAVAVDGSAILRLRNQLFQENITISRRNIELIGGHADCSSSSPTGTSTISGTSSSASTLVVQNSRTDPEPSATNEVVLVNLDVVNGQGSAFGGGVQLLSAHSPGFSAITHLTLDNTWVSGNNAIAGGGVSLRNQRAGGQGGDFLMLNGSRIFSNQALDAFGLGGGLHCRGNFTMLILGGDISSNVAGIAGGSGAQGGGAYVDQCSLTWFAQGAGSGAGAVHGNTAHGQGGGLHARNGAKVGLYGAHLAFTPISTRPFRIYANQTQRGDGGAIFATGHFTEVTIDRGWIYNNVGDWQGGAVMAMGASHVIIHRSSQVCHDNRNCSRIAGNRTNVSGGAAVFVHGADTEVTIRRTILNDNLSGTTSAAQASMALVAGGRLRLEDSLLHGVAGPRYAFYVNDGRLRIDRSTVADTHPSHAVFFIQGDGADVRVFDAIVHEASGINMVAMGSGTPAIYADCVLWHDAGLQSVGTVTRSLIDDPGFADRVAGRYYLVSGSPAINYCNVAPPAPAVDLEWRPRGLEHSNQAIVYGSYDLGAFEWPDGLFSDRFDSP
jgi:hypothetical protein